MADTIKIEVAKLTSAITKLTTLVDAIDQHRRSAASASPIALPSLADTQLGLKVARLRDRLPELQTRLDLAKLLDEKGTGQVSYSVPGPDTVQAAKLLITTELTRKLQELKVDDPASRERAAVLAAILAQYGKDPAVANKVMQALGPDGLQKAMRTLRSLTATQPPYFAGVKDPAGERKAVLALQDQMASSLALMLSTASKSLNQDWGNRFAHDTWIAGVLLRYADKQNLSFGKEFFRGVGHSLKDREQGDPLAWDATMRDPDNASFGTESLADSNPMREYLNTADNSAGNAQGALGDDELRKYFLRDRRYQSGDTQLDQVGKVLELATVGAARSSNDDEARTAADISSHVLWMTKGDNTRPLSAFTDEVGGILATYIQDVDRAVNGGDLAPGASDIAEYRIGIGPDDGLARYQIGLDTASLKSSLAFIRDDEVAMSKVGEAITLFNQTRMDWGAEHHKPNDLSDPFVKTARESAQLQSTFTNEAIEGDLDNLDRRIKAMNYMTAPLDNLNSVLAVGKVPLGELINDGVIGAARDAAADHAVQAALREANREDGRAIAQVQLQAAYAAVRAMPDKAEVTDWPRINGQLKTFDQLEDQEISAMLQRIRNRTGVTGIAADGIEDAWKTVDDRYK